MDLLLFYYICNFFLVGGMASAVKNALGKFLEGGTWDAVRRAVVMTRFPANARLVGTDSAGNRYYEQSPEDARHPNQNRFVEYADGWNGDASQVPSSWHAWLHHMSDLTGDEVEKQFGKPWSMKQARVNETGNMSKVYVPPGFVLHEHFKDELKHRAENIWSDFDPSKGPVSVAPVVEKNLDELD